MSVVSSRYGRTGASDAKELDTPQVNDKEYGEGIERRMVLTSHAPFHLIGDHHLWIYPPWAVGSDWP